MKKIFLVYLSLSIITLSAFAQPGNTGMRFSHYGGTMSTYENPALGANGHTKWEVQLFNVNNIFENNELKLDWNKIVTDGEFDFGNRSISSQVPAQDFSFRNVLEIQGPAVFYNYKKKYAFGINTRTRFFFQMNDANLDLADAALNDDNFNLTDYGPIREDFINLNLNLLTDIGFTGSAQILKTKRHSLYAGASLRFYKGIAAIDFTGRNIDINPDKIVNADSVVEFSADMQFNSSMPNDLDLLSGGSGNGLGFGEVMNNAFGKSAGSGIGGDIGAVYQGMLLNRSFKASASITDIGTINYNNGNQRSASFVANNVQIPVDSFDNFPSGYDSIKAWAAGYGVAVDSGSASFKQALPTRLNLYGEMQVLKGFHVGVATSANLSSNNGKASSYASYTAIIPRWQSKMLEAWVPVSYNYFSRNLKAGLGFRLAYLYFGSDDLLGLARSNAKSVNFYLGLRVSGNYSKRKIKKAEK